MSLRCKLLGHKFVQRRFRTESHTFTVIRCIRGCNYVHTMMYEIPNLMYYYAPKAFDALMHTFKPLERGTSH